MDALANSERAISYFADYCYFIASPISSDKIENIDSSVSHFIDKDFENSICMLVDNVRAKRWHNKIYSDFFYDSKSYVTWENYEEIIFEHLKIDKFLPATPENFYVNNICKLPNIEAIVYGVLPTEKHFITILSKRDLMTREKIYLVELKMFDIFKNENFRFSVDYIHNSEELASLIKGKSVLFHKHSIYGTN